jgi:RimJ/RimL family protein N-acetyltransferase
VTTETAAGPILVGDRVRLRPAVAADAPYFMRWGNEPDFAWHQWGRRPGRFPDAQSFVSWTSFFSERNGRLFVIEHGGRPIGFANYRDWRPKPRSCEIGIGIGEPALWSQGLGRDALRALLRYLVDDLGAHRVSLSVLAFNDRAIAAYKASGFQVEGIERDAVMTDDETFVDDVRMGFIAGRRPPGFDPRPTVLQGRHVRLEPLRMGHAAALFEAVRDPDVWTWLGVGPPEDQAVIDRYVRQALDLQITGEHMPWATIRATDGKVVGTTRYGAIDRTNRSVEIGWTMLGPGARRTAINTEAKYLQLRHAFEDLGATRVWLKTHVRNERSRRAIERIGAKLDGIIRNERILANGETRDACYYSFIDREWPDARRGLEDLMRYGSVQPRPGPSRPDHDPLLR